MFAEVNKQTVVTFPYDYDTLCKKNPYTKFSQDDLLTMYAGTEANLSGNELVRVSVANKPQFDSQTQTVVQQEQPSLINGIWTLGWSIKTLSAEEQLANQNNKASEVRADRNQRLADTDWRFRSDMTPSQAWKDYCQALRDVPAQAGFPHNVQWPNKPE